MTTAVKICPPGFFTEGASGRSFFWGQLRSILTNITDTYKECQFQKIKKISNRRLQKGARYDA